MTYLLVVVGRNCEPWAEACLQSIAAQHQRPFRVCVVDDASTDGTPAIVEHFAQEHGWTYQLNYERLGAMRNQYEAWHALDGQPGDVVVWCDLDDRLAHPNVLNILERHYRRGALLTYGNYRPDPPDPGCPPVARYPASVIGAGTYRWYSSRGHILYNHLRTVSWDILAQLGEDDFRDDAGDWWTTGPDAAVMLPALELAGRAHAVIGEVLYVYTSNADHAEWRTVPETVRANHRQMFARPPKNGARPPRVGPRRTSRPYTTRTRGR